MKTVKKQKKQERLSAFFVRELDYSVTGSIGVYKEGIIEKQSSTEENDQLNLAYFLKKAFLGQIARRYFIIGSVARLLPSCLMEKSAVVDVLKSENNIEETKIVA